MPSTLTLGVYCQPVGRESSLPNVRLPFPNSLRNDLRETRFRKSSRRNTLQKFESFSVAQITNSPPTILNWVNNRRDIP